MAGKQAASKALGQDKGSIVPLLAITGLTGVRRRSRGRRRWRTGGRRLGCVRPGC